jgi:hypothetical protein
MTGDLRAAGLGWHGNGQATLTGPLYRLAANCDRAFAVLADACGAEPQAHPPLIDIGVLAEIDYLSSFPHLATFAVCLDADEANLKEFVARGPVDADGAVRLARTAPVTQILTPAACYPVYPHLRGEALAAARRLTVRATCFRREAHYEPLRRQWSFQMRELVCLGTRAEVVSFLAAGRDAVDALCRTLDLPITWEAATDPFFEPARHPGHLAQRLRPTKHEARLGGDLAIASVNLHEDHFGAAFGITRAGEAAVSGCVAFGVERWLYALTQRHGTDPAGWPDVTAAARAAATRAALS